MWGPRIAYIYWLDGFYNRNSSTKRPHTPAVPTGQPHLDLVLVNYTRQAMQAGLTFGFGSLFLFKFLVFIPSDWLAVSAAFGLTKILKMKVSYICA